MDTVIVTWAGGGVIQPALGLARLLAAAGHRVRILGPAAIETRAIAAGATFRPWPPGVEIALRPGHSLDDDWDDVFENFLLGSAPPAALAAELRRGPADVVVVDFMLRSTLFEAERLGVPHVALVHMQFRQFGVPNEGRDPDEEWGWRWTFGRVNAVRAQMGLDPLPLASRSAQVALIRHVPGAIAVMPREFDVWPEPPPGLVHVGPIFEEPADPDGRPRGTPWDSPWTAGDERPLVVVSLGTTYMHQALLLGRLAVAADAVGARVVALTGEALDPSALPTLPPAVLVRQFIPHASILPETALLITHGGMGSLMAAFAAAVPTVCLPLGRDQVVNSAVVAELGTSLTLPPDATDEEMRSTIDAALRSYELVSAARRMRDVVMAYRGGAEAVAVVERTAAFAATA